MSIDKLKEAAKVAYELTEKASFKIVLFLVPRGVAVRALDGQRVQSHIVSWEQLTQSEKNPLLPAIQIVSESFQAENIDE